jgi:membrane protein
MKRLVGGTVDGLVRVQIFDRSMTLAAQAFTSIFPILLLLGSVVGPRTSARVADIADLPEASQELLDESLRGPGVGAFGAVGAVAVLISATSLSRALGRAYGHVWDLPKVPGGPAMTLRWLAAVVVLSVFLIGSRLLGWVTDRLPPSELSSAVLLSLADLGIAVLVPWLVLRGAVAPRLLLPGGCLFALVMLALRPAASVVLPRAMDVSVERYGTIGLAFTYVSWLYVLSFVLLGTAVVGQVLARDSGAVGRFVRGVRGSQ